MDCNTAQSYIEPFLHNELTDDEKESFISHVNGCKDCRNELEFYYITYSVFDELDHDENGETYDYIAALDRKLESSRKTVSMRRAIRQIAFIAALIIMALVAMFILLH
ncbi:MAG: zf-HC2 domain-containing protein [Lachnospiraceae bacterium]|nr:zf-HC2 domain-containing protein [Lachnospiraceae bacterium]